MERGGSRTFGSGFIVPLGDNGEKKRLDFWAKQTEPISADLLRIPGWLDEDPEREVLVQDGAGVRVVKAREKPRNVLFRIPQDRRTHELWESVLYRLRLEQSRRRTADAHVATAERNAAAAVAAVQKQWELLFEANELARFSAQRARDATSPEDRAESLADAAARVEDARAAASRWRVARRHSEDAVRAVAYWKAQAGAKSYPGLWASINSFLDMQALSVASMASDEFTKKGARRGAPTPAVQDRSELIADAP